MATFSDDFSAASGTANQAATTAISGWTGIFAGSSTYQNATIVTEGGTIGGKILRVTDTGWGGTTAMYPTSIGSLADNTTTEVLVCWRIGTGITTSNGSHFAAPFVRLNTATAARRYQIGYSIAAGTEDHQLHYIHDGNEWSTAGALKDVTTDYVQGDWWWSRVQVDGGATSNWRWRTWKDGTSEPGSWQNADVSAADESRRGGAVGVGLLRSSGVGTLIDVQYFSVGTAGDAAPEPGGGGGGGTLPPNVVAPRQAVAFSSAAQRFV